MRIDGSSVLQVGGAAPYDVVVGTGLLGELPGMLGDGVRRVAVIHPRALGATGEVVRADLSAHGYEAHAIEIPAAPSATPTAAITAATFPETSTA